MLTLTRRARNSRDRGASSLFFILVGLPLLLLSLGISIDLTQVIIAHTRIVNTAEAAVLAGALQQDQFTGCINTSSHLPQADRNADIDCAVVSTDTGTIPFRRAHDVWNIAESKGLLAVDSITKTFRVTNGTDMHVEVDYSHDGLIFLPIIMAMGEGGDSTVSVTFSKTASICDMDDPNGPTRGHCDRPLR